jgi:hypothetical protein
MSLFAKFNAKFSLRPIALFVPIVAPIVLGTVVVAPQSSFAATLAGARSTMIIDNFSHSPTGVEGFSQSNAQVRTLNGPGSATADANGNYALTTIPTTSFITDSFATAEGTGLAYAALGTSETIAAGYNFFVPQSESFKFDFTGSLKVGAFTDGGLDEKANAIGTIDFQLFGGADENSLTLLDTLSLFASDDGNGQLNFQRQGTGGFNSFSSSETTPGIQTTFTGSFARNFAAPTYLRLIERKTNVAFVGQGNVPIEAVPEPHMIGGLLLFAYKNVRKRAKQKQLAA